MTGANFRGLLLICLSNITVTTKSASHTLQFALKDYVLLPWLSLQNQLTYITVRGVVAIYYTAVGLEKFNREPTDREHTEKAITEATLIVDGLSGWVGQYSEEISKTKANFASGGICSKLNYNENFTTQYIQLKSCLILFKRIMHLNSYNLNIKIKV